MLAVFPRDGSAVAGLLSSRSEAADAVAAGDAGACALAELWGIGSAALSSAAEAERSECDLPFSSAVLRCLSASFVPFCSSSCCGLWTLACSFAPAGEASGAREIRVRVPGRPPTAAHPPRR